MTVLVAYASKHGATQHPSPGLIPHDDGRDGDTRHGPQPNGVSMAALKTVTRQRVARR